MPEPVTPDIGRFVSEGFTIVATPKPKKPPVINMPDIADVSFPTMIGAIPSKPQHTPAPPRKRRRPVKYKGVSLSRRPMKFEAKVLALSEIPLVLDAATLEVTHPDASLFRAFSDIADYGSQQVLHELVRQGAPADVLALRVNLHEPVLALAVDVETDRSRELTAAYTEVDAKLSKRRVGAARRAKLARDLSDVRAPWIYKRHAKSGINQAFALGRNLTIQLFRRKHGFDLATHHDEDGKFISKADAVAGGDLAIDAVIMTAVMDTNTCEECEAVDGEVMEFGDDRQKELHPPYVKCLGGDKCRCVQIALLSDGSQIDVDEIDEDTLD